jgi:hypothetical protein
LSWAPSSAIRTPAAPHRAHLIMSEAAGRAGISNFSLPHEQRSLTSDLTGDLVLIWCS